MSEQADWREQPISAARTKRRGYLFGLLPKGRAHWKKSSETHAAVNGEALGRPRGIFPFRFASACANAFRMSDLSGRWESFSTAIVPCFEGSRALLRSAILRFTRLVLFTVRDARCLMK